MPEIKADLESGISAAWRVPISTMPNSVVGQTIGVFSAAIDDIWQVAEDAYNAMYPNTADGISLSNSVGFAGVRRLNAQKTKIYVVCYGNPGTIITTGAQIQGNDNNRYETIRQSSISLSNAVNLSLTLTEVISGTTYSVNIAGTVISVIASISDTATSILVALTVGIPQGWVANVVNNILTYRQDNRIDGSIVSYSTTLQLVEVGSPIDFYAVNVGEIDPTIGTVTNIITQIAGWFRASNESLAYVGRELETPTELRQRYSATVTAQGTAMVESISANLLQNVANVTAALVYENTSDTIDEFGRPPHSIEAVVQGGDEREVGNMIWLTKAAGIDTFGNISVPIIDSQGINRIMNFNRPESVLIYLRVTIYEHYEIKLHGNAVQETLRLLIELADKHTVGQDVILQMFSGYVIRNVSGIGYIEIEGSTNGITYTSSNIPISQRQLAVFDESRIQVVIA